MSDFSVSTVCEVGAVMELISFDLSPSAAVWPAPLVPSLILALALVENTVTFSLVMGLWRSSSSQALEGGGTLRENKNGSEWLSQTENKRELRIFMDM